MEESNLIKQRQEKGLSLRDEGQDLFPNNFRPGNEIAELRRRFDNAEDEVFEGLEEVFSLAGQILARRDYGKSVFFDISDHSGRMQAYMRRQDVEMKTFDLFKKLDIGDIVGLEGRIFRTRTKELTIMVQRLELVTKSFLPLPEKYHEISVEFKYRQRYVDLIMNEKTREVFQKRTRIIALLRRFLSEKGYIEVETPMMQPIPGGATAKPFETFHQALDMKLFLRVAPELYLKRLLVGGFNRVFELNRNFRNEGVSTQHNPEFTMLEFYQTYATFEDLMDLTEEMVALLARDVCGSERIVYQGQEVDLAPPWTRLNFHQSLKEVGGVPADVCENLESAETYCHEHGLEMPANRIHGKLLAKIFDVTVEPKLVNPTFITGYPADISPLARRNKDNPEITDRFEFFITGREFGNGFSELNDPFDQRERFLTQVEERAAGDEEALYMDEDYVRALMYGMPPAAGEGIGVDRLVMLLTDAASIRDVIFFPHLRPER
ncbi:MAG: lysine--tRNA ligase [Deltaproteobacteria bacterium]|nr:lysine--tRNA ligase [Deltaproteobacteria bacterium]